MNNKKIMVSDEKYIIKLIETESLGVIPEEDRRWCGMNIDGIDKTFCGIELSAENVILAECDIDSHGAVDCELCYNIIHHAKGFDV